MVQDLVYVVDKEPDIAEAHHMPPWRASRVAGSIRDRVDHDRDPTQSRRHGSTCSTWRRSIWPEKSGTTQPRCSTDFRTAQTRKSRKPRARVWPTCLPLKKYGVLPEDRASQDGTGGPAPASVENDEEDAHSGKAEAVPAEPVPDRRKVQFVRGKLVKLDCSQAPAAILTVQDWRSNDQTAHRRLQITVAGWSG